LVIWAHRRVVEIACEFFGGVEALEGGSHASASACCAGRSWCALVCCFG
jgi:hypothetical protein